MICRPLGRHRTADKSAALLLWAAVSCMGCLRFGYGPKQQEDAGSTLPDAGVAYAGGRGGSAGKTEAGKGAAGGGGQMSQAGGGQAGQAGGGQMSQAGQDGAMDDADGGIDKPDAGGGAADAGAADSGTPISYELCPEMPGMLFCSGFEAAGDRWKYFTSNNGSTTPLTTLPRTGEHSLVTVIYGPAALSEARWGTDVLSKQKSGDVWMRFYNFMPSSVTVSEYFSIGFMGEAAAPNDGFELRLLPSGMGINTPVNGSVGVAATTFPPNAWVCVELHVRIDDKLGIYEAYLNGGLAVSSGLRDTLPGDGYTNAEIGIHSAGPNQSQVQLFVDDVVIAGTRIGCN